MKLVIQRVQEASVKVDHQVIGQIDRGLLVFIGVGHEDDEKVADLYLRKLLNLRIFEDENGKTNLSLQEVSGELLLVSQFTLYADCKKGNRPSFTKAGAPDVANRIYEYMIEQCRLAGVKVECGEFGADMKVSLINDGPFTILLDENLK